MNVGILFAVNPHQNLTLGAAESFVQVSGRAGRRASRRIALGIVCRASPVSFCSARIDGQKKTWLRFAVFRRLRRISLSVFNIWLILSETKKEL
jgi:hypothetical protein